ncbi:MAG TPA: aminotransferase class I/II-fold pyridoxal phosphate-dependent enzyme [Solirubrobacteraceae bacterium]|nr:aminotransferase class I/II-fold pyridoxal phosphate-dependent enzyme [Solirubrobacteraceae bacterium]
MGLLDYYRQFEGLSEDEVNQSLREQAAERRSRELARVAPLDLARNTWPGLPHPYVVNAVTYVARRGLHRYTDREANQLQTELAHRHSVERERVVVGSGAAHLMSSAAHALIEPGQEAIIPWPGYQLLPIMTRRARGHAVPVAGFSVDDVLAAVNDRTRMVALANPNDPTGERLSTAELGRLLEALPEQVVVVLDEALVDFVDAEPVDASLALLEEHPRLLVFRSFSKAWGLAGLRVGYAIGGPGSEPLLESLAPELGLDDLAQAGALESLRSCSPLVAQRATAVASQRRLLIARLRELGLDVTNSQANHVWVARPGLDGAELAHRLERAGVLVAPGAALGDPGHVRIAVQDQAAADRLISALTNAL